MLPDNIGYELVRVPGFRPGMCMTLPNSLISKQPSAAGHAAQFDGAGESFEQNHIDVAFCEVLIENW